MAVVVNNLYTIGLSGRIGDALLYKQYGNKTVVTRFPQRSLKTPSERQLVQRKKFALAVLNTRQWLKEAPKKQFLIGLKQKWASVSAYHAGIRYFMTEPDTYSINTQSTDNQTVNTPAISNTNLLRSPVQSAGNELNNPRLPPPNDP